MWPKPSAVELLGQLGITLARRHDKEPGVVAQPVYGADAPGDQREELLLHGHLASPRWYDGEPSRPAPSHSIRLDCENAGSSGAAISPG